MQPYFRFKAFLIANIYRKSLAVTFLETTYWLQKPDVTSQFGRPENCTGWLVHHVMVSKVVEVKSVARNVANAYLHICDVEDVLSALLILVIAQYNVTWSNCFVRSVYWYRCLTLVMHQNGIQDETYNLIKETIKKMGCCGIFHWR